MNRQVSGWWLALLLGTALGGGLGWWVWASKPADRSDANAAERKILYYRNPMGLADTSPTPKKDEMGMDYIPVYADEVSAGQSAERQVLYYRNPMGLADTSPTPKKDEMGMDYIPVYADEEEAAKPAERKILYYRNPMGLADTSPTPKKDEMGMDYIPVYADELTGTGVRLNPEKIQTLGVRTAPVARRQLVRTVRALGQFQVDERRRYSFTTKFDGWIERLRVNTTGQSVKAGELLMEVYSPELVAAQQEYLIARDSQSRLALDPAPAGGRRLTLPEAALERFRVWDIPAAELKRLVKTSEVRRTLGLVAPADGVVLEMGAIQGQRFSAGQPLYQIADLSRLWLLADVYEQDVALIKPGQQVKVRVNAYPGETFDGRVDFIYPTFNAETRTLRVRVELANPGLRLKPAMFGQAEFSAPIGPEPMLVVPRSALIDSGVRQVVLVADGEGRFAPREVKVGAHGDQMAGAEQGDELVQILAGLQEGESVVVSANFLIDAESNLRSALNSLSQAEPQAPASTAVVGEH